MGRGRVVSRGLLYYSVLVNAMSRKTPLTQRFKLATTNKNCTNEIQLGVEIADVAQSMIEKVY